MSLTLQPETHSKEDAEATPDFKANISWTFQVPVDRLFEAWNARPPIMGGFSVARVTADESLWATWVAGSNLEASFFSRGDNESEVTIRHTGLNNAEHVASTTDYWRNDILRELAVSMRSQDQSEPSRFAGAQQGHDYRYLAQRDAASKMMQATHCIFVAIVVLLAIRFVLLAAGMDQQEAFTAFIVSATAPFARPFETLFPTPVFQGVVLELQSLAAVFSYALAGWLSGRFVLALFSGPANARLGQVRTER